MGWCTPSSCHLVKATLHLTAESRNLQEWVILGAGMLFCHYWQTCIISCSNQNQTLLGRIHIHNRSTGRMECAESWETRVGKWAFFLLPSDWPKFGREWLNQPVLTSRPLDRITVCRMVYEARVAGQFMKREADKSSKDIYVLQMSKMLYALNKKRSQC